MISRGKILVFYGAIGIVLVISNLFLGDEYGRLRFAINLVLVVVLAVSVVYTIAALASRSRLGKPEERQVKRLVAAKAIAERIIAKLKR